MASSTRKDFQGPISEEVINLNTEPDDPSTNSEESSIPPYSIVSVNCIQKAGQVVLTIIDAAAPTYLVGPFIPPFGDPDKSTLEVAVYPVNDNLGEVLGALTTKPDPTSGLKAAGGGNRGIGLAKDTVNKLLGLAVCGGVGYGVGEFTIKYGPFLFQSTHPVSHFLGVILVSPIYRAPLLGILGLGLNGTTKCLGMKAWEQCIPSEPEKAPKRPLHILQTGGGYALRWFNALVNSEMVLFNLKLLGHSFTFPEKLGIFMAVDVFHQVATHLAYVPRPIDSLMDPPQVEEVDSDEVSLSTSESGSEREGCPSPVRNFASNLLMPVGATVIIYSVSYAIDQGLNALCRIGSLGPDCDQDTLNNRLIHTAPVAALFMTDYLIRQVTPLLVPHIKRCWGSMWSSCKEKREDMLERENFLTSESSTDSPTTKILRQGFV